MRDLRAILLADWIDDCTARGQQTISDSRDTLFTSANNALLQKIYAYQVYCGQLKNFSSLVPALNEWEEDLDETLTLLLSGHYKGALLMLRCHFELANALITAIRSNQPTGSFFTKRLQKDRHFNPGTFRSKIGDAWCDEIISIYSELSGFSHASGESSSHLSLSPQLPPPSFSQQSLDYCLQKVNEVIDHNTGLMEVCFKAEWFKQDLLASILGKSYQIEAADTHIQGQTEFLLEHITSPLVRRRLDLGDS